MTNREKGIFKKNDASSAAWIHTVYISHTHFHVGWLKFQFEYKQAGICLQQTVKFKNVLEKLEMQKRRDGWLTPIFSARGQFASEIKQKQSERDSYRNTNSVCDSVCDSLLPTSSAHTIIHFSNGAWGLKTAGGVSPALPSWNNEWGLGVC